MHRKRLLWIAWLVACCLVIALVAFASTAAGATRKAANRCRPHTTSPLVTYRCPAAYPEAIHVGGYTFSKYRLTWKVTCGSRSAQGSKNLEGAFYVLVDRVTQPSAYKVMEGGVVCWFDIRATRTSRNGSITMELFINVNHPAPAHN